MTRVESPKFRAAPTSTSYEFVFLTRALPADRSFSVLSIVVPTTRHKHQVTWRIVLLVFVAMVNQLATFEPTTQFLLHHHSMLVRVPSYVGEVMTFTDIHQNVSVTADRRHL